jgi:hypothetical protein
VGACSMTAGARKGDGPTLGGALEPCPPMMTICRPGSPSRRALVRLVADHLRRFDSCNARHVVFVGREFSLMGNCPHRRRVVAEVDHVAGADVEVDGKARRGSGRDAGEPEHKARGAVADHFVIGIE